MIEVELKSYLNSFKEDLKNLLLKHELYGIPEWDTLLSSLTQLTDSVNIDEDYYISLNQSPIDKYDLSDYAVKYINSGMGYKAAAEVLSINAGIVISEREVKEYIETYSVIDRVKKKKKEVGNIFDIQDRMQDIYSQLLEHLEEIKQTDKEEFLRAKTTRQQVVLDTYKEVRMLTKDASSILESISHQEQLQEFRKVILESIKEVSPAVAQTIIRKLRQNKALFTALLPPD